MQSDFFTPARHAKLRETLGELAVSLPLSEDRVQLAVDAIVGTELDNKAEAERVRVRDLVRDAFLLRYYQLRTVDEDNRARLDAARLAGVSDLSYVERLNLALRQSLLDDWRDGVVLTPPDVTPRVNPMGDAPPWLGPAIRHATRTEETIESFDALAECYRCGHTVFTDSEIGTKCSEEGCEGTYMRRNG